MRNMKKKAIIITLILFSCISVYAISKSFTIDSSKFSLAKSTKKNDVTSEFNKKYQIQYNISSKEEKEKKELTELTKKITYLLLGEQGSTKETPEEYYKRRQDYLSLRYNPKVPKDPNNIMGLDTDSQEYKDDLVSGMTIPTMFNSFNELDIKYNQIGPIRVSITKDMVISMITIPDVTMKEEDINDPMKYNKVKTNLAIYYSFKKLNNKYKLYYLFGETNDDLSEYFDDIETNENTKSLEISKNYDTKLNQIYDFSKMKNLTDTKINKIYNDNYKNIVVLNAYYNNKVTDSANGFLLDDGLVVTTWSYLEKALINSQFISIKSGDDKVLKIDGIVTADPENDLAIIKLKDKITSNIKLGNTDKLKIEDPVLSISSKSGVGLTAQTGIVISKDGYIQSAIPLTISDEGSPLFNEDGEVVGINTSKSINTSVSMSIESKALKKLKDKLSKDSFKSIKTISFQKLKEKYYYTNIKNENKINNIPKSKWNKYKKIGNIEKNIKMNLIKANYDNNVISLRYSNTISEFISGMQLSASFKEELVNQGFKQTLNSTNKCIYTNKDYEVVIIDEFDYLIVVMVKL